MSVNAYDRSPEEIQSRIEETRASLDRKLEEIEHRLSPREQLRKLTDRVDPESYVPWAAIGAIATGTYLAISGWRRYHRADGIEDLSDPDLAEL